MLNSFIELAPLLPRLLGRSKICVWATNEDEYILFENQAGLPLGISKGTKLSDGGTPRLAMKEGRTIERIVPREVYGVTFRSVCIPVPGGTIGLSIDLEDEQRVQESIETLSSFAEEVAAAAVETAEKSNSVHQSVENVSELARQGVGHRQSLEKVTRVLREITDQLQLLSLNALIEAARAGEHGRTFNIVANEVKKLSHTGKEQLTEIHAVIGEVSRLLEGIGQEIESIRSFTTAQTVSAGEMASSIQSVSSHLENLSTLAKGNKE
ncbi:methyl-accepting chemotaxis protein [Ammoniphilus sp. YIM 78166]|uniref:methyl-accepting chemotaxis protein n=1 Tax=Ammoniphilus sp. YIM 78166 TaxID=1644106 RepID=UPI00106F0BD3|nr:methyl-accepting chemotaxis protein [Ammoniphilus sp. YIM 78166]